MVKSVLMHEYPTSWERMHRFSVLLIFLAVLISQPSCQSRKSPATTPQTPSVELSPKPAWFEDITTDVGLDFIQDVGPTGNFFMPQANGAGCGFIHEIDPVSNQSNLYILLLNNAGPESKSVNRLYYRQADGKWKDVTVGSGLDLAGYYQGVAIGDVNNDGLPDVLLTQYLGVKLFLNLGSGHFKDITQEAGLSNPHWGTSAAFFDYDRDGWLDLVIANYVSYDPSVKCQYYPAGVDFCGPATFPGSPGKLFRNRGGTRAAGNSVQFSDVSVSTGIASKVAPGLGVVCADFDGDGWPDIFIANDEKPNHLWINCRQPDGSIVFQEQAEKRGIAVAEKGTAFAGMGIALGDVDNKGMFDLFVTHLGTESHTLWKQGPRGKFTDRTTRSGLLWTRWRATGFGTLLADFDLDGYLDLALVNGGISKTGLASKTDLGFWEPYAEKNQLLANEGNGKFRDISQSNPDFCGRWNVARGLASSDIDGDGAPDLLLTAIGDRARLFRNVAPGRGHWLAIRVLDPRWKRDAYGAEVRVQMGNQHLVRWINPAESFLSSGSPFAHFGLGKASNVEKIKIKWPDGELDQVEEEFPGVGVDQTITLIRGKGRTISKSDRNP